MSEPNDLPKLTLDWDAYLPLLEDEDIPEEQKRELIKTLWLIVVTFVDLGFGIETTQTICGETPDEIADLLDDVLDWDEVRDEDIPDIEQECVSSEDAPERRP
ncbi:hypothetical protein AADZ90_022130 [Aestuariibius sp. 2305UL40-4]|uniref:hypothetical protein n=1 Tax=Aestuariibius violaceus TaxID=3234132 RepID=UPI00345E9455